tara:strand:- start:777 stop:1949 length:1173 start_codon:yes stop_codon:yes gene_type:complete
MKKKNFGWRYKKKNYDLPKKVIFCKRCVMTNQRPRITFNQEGICSACQFTDIKNKIDWKLRKQKLKKICNKYRKRDGSFDVIVPSSGGKDSGFVAHYLKNEFGMNPLTVTWAPHEYTSVGFENFQNHIKIGDLNNILCTPSGKIHRKLTNLGMKLLGDPFIPFIYGQHNVPYLIAQKFQIPFIMYGENSEVEYGGTKELNDAASLDQLKEKRHDDIFFSGLRLKEMIKAGIEEKDLYYYKKPKPRRKDVKFKSYFMSYFHKWNPQENYYYCVKNTGFKPDSVRSEGTYTRFASLDDKLDGFHFYLMYIKFGIGRATSDVAHEIREGHMTREEGIELVKKYDGEFPEKFFHLFLEYCKLKQSEFYEIVDSWRADHIWGKTGNGWKLKHEIK